MEQDKSKDLIYTYTRNYENAKAIYERAKRHYDLDSNRNLKETDPEQYYEYRQKEKDNLDFYAVILEMSKEQLDKILDLVENNKQ